MRHHMLLAFLVILLSCKFSLGVEYHIGDAADCDYVSLDDFLTNPPSINTDEEVFLLLHQKIGGHHVHNFQASTIPALQNKRVTLAGVVGSANNWDYDIYHTVIISDYFYYDCDSQDQMTVKYLKFDNINRIDEYNQGDLQITPIFRDLFREQFFSYSYFQVFDCEFVNVQKDYCFLVNSQGIINIYYNDLFMGCSGISMRSTDSTRDYSFVLNCTFLNCNYSLATLGIMDSGFLIANCLFVGSNATGDKHHTMAYEDDYPECGYCITSDINASYQFWGNQIDVTANPNNPYLVRLSPDGWQSFVKFNDIDNMDFRYKMNSVCLDYGTYRYGLHQLPIEAEFDNTDPDVGYKRKIPVVTISSWPQTLEDVNYLITSDIVADVQNLAIPGGANFKIVGNYSLTLKSTGGNMTIGSPDGLRVVISGKENINSIVHADCLVFGEINSPTNMTVNGLCIAGKFNNIYFNYINSLTLKGENAEDPRNIYFSSNGGTKITMIGCQDALVDGLTFNQNPIQSENDFLGSLWFGLGTIKIRNSYFFDTQSSYGINIVNSEATLSNNDFIGNGSFESLKSAGSVMSLIRNKFHECDRPQMTLYYSSTCMQRGMANIFLSDDNGYLFDPFINAVSGRIDADCGYNVFCNYDFYESLRIINWTDYEGDDLLWRKNFFGLDETFSIGCGLADDYLPDWIDASNCLGEAHPLIYWCPSIYEDEDLQLWEAGQDAEGDFEIESAIWYYSELIRLYPKSIYAAMAENRIKELGKENDSFGAIALSVFNDYLTTPPIEVDTWLSSKVTIDEILLNGILNDRILAEAELDSILANSEDIVMGSLAQLATSELQFSHEQGGFESISSDKIDMTWIDDVNNLFETSERLVQAETTINVPEDFNLAPIYPNPFNATTAIVIDIKKSGNLSVKLFNLLGEKVCTIHNGFVNLGTHMYTINGDNFSSGIYLVNIEMGDKTTTKKITMIK